LKILHVWSVAGVAETIAKYMDRQFGTQSTVLVRKSADRFGFNAMPMDDGAYRFALRSIRSARKNDVVQVHSWDRIVPWMKRLGGRPVSLTYHNFNIAKEWKAREGRWSKADAAVIATPEIWRGLESARFIADPVDTELFHDEGNHVPGTALYTDYWAAEEAEHAASERGLKLTTLQRETNPVLHSEMPTLLNKYEYYIDIKRAPTISPDVIPAGSKTRLEALACGCKVVTWDGTVLEGLPDENRPENVAKAYHDLYDELLTKRPRP